MKINTTECLKIETTLEELWRTWCASWSDFSASSIGDDAGIYVRTMKAAMQAFLYKDEDLIRQFFRDGHTAMLIGFAIEQLEDWDGPVSVTIRHGEDWVLVLTHEDLQY